MAQSQQSLLQQQDLESSVGGGNVVRGHSWTFARWQYSIQARMCPQALYRILFSLHILRGFDMPLIEDRIYFLILGSEMEISLSADDDLIKDMQKDMSELT
jgi:hypothetical protein